MRAAIIENGVVVNIAVAEEDVALANGWILTEEAQIGWTYDGEKFAAPPEPEPVVVVPQSVGPYQARAALLAADLLDDVEALIADPETDRAIKIAWEYASEFKRESPFIEQMAAALSLTEKQVDELFIAAAQVE